MEAVNFHHEAFLDTAGRAHNGRSLELHLAVLERALLWQLRGCPEPGQGSGCVSPHLALPGKRLSSLGKAGRPALLHRQRSATPPTAVETAGVIQPGERTCLAASLLPRRTSPTHISPSAELLGRPPGICYPTPFADPAFEWLRLLQEQMRRFCAFFPAG